MIDCNRLGLHHNHRIKKTTQIKTSEAGGKQSETERVRPGKLQVREVPVVQHAEQSEVVDRLELGQGHDGANVDRLGDDQGLQRDQLEVLRGRRR